MGRRRRSEVGGCLRESPCYCAGWQVRTRPTYIVRRAHELVRPGLVRRRRRAPPRPAAQLQAVYGRDPVPAAWRGRSLMMPTIAATATALACLVLAACGTPKFASRYVVDQEG